MNKIYSLLFGLILFGVCQTGYGQDTAKHAAKKPEGIVVPSVYHPITPRPGSRHFSDTGVKAKVKNTVKHDSSKTAAQPSIPAGYVDNTLNGQYNALIKKIYPYARNQVSDFYNNAMDTLNAVRQQLQDSTTKLSSQNTIIMGLHNDAATKEAELALNLAKNGQIDFFGLAVPLVTYQYIMWGLVVVFIGFSIAIYSLSGSNRREAAYRAQQHEELMAEYEAFKTKANDKEIKLARELQTERNKVDELTGRRW